MTLEIHYEDKRASNLCHVNEKVYFNENKKGKPAVIMAVGIGRIEVKNFAPEVTNGGVVFTGEAVIHNINAEIILHP